MPLQPTDVPSRQGIQDAIDEAVEAHADLDNEAGLHYDSGWITLPLRAGFTVGVGGETPQYRRIGSEVFLRGRIGGSFSTSVAYAADLPAGFRPSYPQAMFALATGSPSVGGRMYINDGGIIQIQASAAQTTASCSCSFLVD